MPARGVSCKAHGAREPLLERWTREDALHELGLTVQVSFPVASNGLDQTSLEVSVSGNQGGVRAKCVAEGEVPRQLRAALVTHIEVMRMPAAASHASWTVSLMLPERFPPGDTLVSAMNVADRLEPGSHLVKARRAPGHDVDIQDRLGRESGDGGAANVLDRHVETRKDVQQGTTKPGKLTWPPRVILDDFDQLPWAPFQVVVCLISRIIESLADFLAGSLTQEQLALHTGLRSTAALAGEIGVRIRWLQTALDAHRNLRRRTETVIDLIAADLDGG